MQPAARSGAVVALPHLAAIGLALVLAASAQDEKGRTTLTYLGTAGWEISDGKTVVLIHPYLTRIPAFEQCCGYDRLLELLRASGVPNTAQSPAGGPRRIQPQDDELISDTATIDKHLNPR